MKLAAHQKIQAMNMAAAGMGMYEITEHFGCGYYDLSFKLRDMRRFRAPEAMQKSGGKRNPNTAAIVQMRRDGKILQVIGDSFGITRERARQIIARHVARSGENIAKPLRERKASPICLTCSRRISSNRFSQCAKCAAKARRTISDEYARAIEDRARAGEPFSAIAADLGKHYQNIAKIVWLRMREQGRLTKDEADAVFGPRGWRWLQNHLPMP